MRKITAIVLSAILIFGIFAGCSASGNSDGISYNNEFNEESMVTASGEKIKIDTSSNAVLDSASGLGLYLSDSFMETALKSIQLEPLAPYGFQIVFIPESVKDGISSLMKEKDLSEEEFNGKFMEIYKNTEKFIALARVNKSDDTSKKFFDQLKTTFDKNEKIATFDGDTYYILFNDELKSHEGMTDEDVALYNKILESVPEIKNNVLLFPPAASSASSSGAGLTSFTAEDMEGNTVTQELFADYDITMINVWATWCGFCIEEMPYLNELYESLPENVNLITIAADADKEEELVADILKESGATFTTLKGSPELSPLLSQVTGFPTTFFVDSKGNLAGQTINGIPARGDDIPEAYMNAINKALESVKK